MNTKQIKLKFRDAINRITGKQPLIEEYFALVRELSKISDKTPAGTPLKNYLMEGLDIITEHNIINLGHGVSTANSYNPYKGPQNITKIKISHLQTMLTHVRNMQQKDMAIMNAKQNVR